MEKNEDSFVEYWSCYPRYQFLIRLMVKPKTGFGKMAYLERNSFMGKTEKC